jgi:hypothetical protein
MELPHHTLWTEADSGLTASAKEAILNAYRELHSRGILHGRPESTKILVGMSRWQPS